MNPLAAIGRVFLGFLSSLGRIALFAAHAISHCVRPPFYPALILRQMVDIGYFSLPVVGLTAELHGFRAFPGRRRRRDRGGPVHDP
jgi:phospholipid/cholesterol/gamma-HCH transport system permease protein